MCFSANRKPLYGLTRKEVQDKIATALNELDDNTLDICLRLSAQCNIMDMR